MSYTPTNWKAGDIITSERLNKLENGVAGASGGGGVTIVNISVTESGGDTIYTMDKTASEVYAACENGLCVTFMEEDVGGVPLYNVIIVDGFAHDVNLGYMFTIKNNQYLAGTDSDYPTYTKTR